MKTFAAFALFTLLCSTGFANSNASAQAANYICAKASKPNEHWIVAMRTSGPEGKLHADVRDGDNKKTYELFCEKTPNFHNYPCQNSWSNAHKEGYAAFYYKPLYRRDRLEIHFSNPEEDTITIHYYDCAPSQ